MKNINKQLNIFTLVMVAMFILSPIQRAEAKMIGVFGGGIFGGGTDGGIEDLGDAEDFSGTGEDDFGIDDPIEDLGDATDFSGTDSFDDAIDFGTDDDGVPDLSDEGYTDDDGDGTDEWVDAGGSGPYAAYCGDGKINQSWEMCDGGTSCTNQCQSTDMCSDMAFARVVVEDAKNIPIGDVTSNVYLANNSLPIPSGTWFLIHDGEDFIVDPLGESFYKPFRGIVVDRDGSRIRVTLQSFGIDEREGYEHVDGYIDFFGTNPTSLSNDTSDDNETEEMSDGIMELNASQDEVDISSGDVDFWLTTGHKDDAFFVNLTKPSECEDDGGPVDNYDGGNDDDDDNHDSNNNDDDDDDGDDDDNDNDGADDSDNDGEVLGAFIGPDASLAQTGYNSTIMIIVAIVTLAGVIFIQSRRKKLQLETIKF